MLSKRGEKMESLRQGVGKIITHRTLRTHVDFENWI